MGFNLGEIEFEKVENGVKIIMKFDGDSSFVIRDENWISVITEMSHKPENAEQHEAAEKFHKGNK